MPKNKAELIKDILEASAEIFGIIRPTIPPGSLSSGLTLAQLRVLLLLYGEGPSHMSAIASQMKIALSSATGIVDNLVKKGMVYRQIDKEDRRLVVCRLTQSGEESIGRLWSMGENQMEELLEGLNLRQLEASAEVAHMLLDSIRSKLNLKPN